MRKIYIFTKREKTLLAAFDDCAGRKKTATLRISNNKQLKTTIEPYRQEMLILVKEGLVEAGFELESLFFTLNNEFHLTARGIAIKDATFYPAEESEAVVQI